MRLAWSVEVALTLIELLVSQGVLGLLDAQHFEGWGGKYGSSGKFVFRVASRDAGRQHEASQDWFGSGPRLHSHKCRSRIGLL